MKDKRIFKVEVEDLKTLDYETTFAAVIVADNVEDAVAFFKKHCNPQFSVNTGLPKFTCVAVGRSAADLNHVILEASTGA